MKHKVLLEDVAHEIECCVGRRRVEFLDESAPSLQVMLSLRVSTMEWTSVPASVLMSRLAYKCCEYYGTIPTSGVWKNRGGARLSCRCPLEKQLEMFVSGTGHQSDFRPHCVKLARLVSPSRPRLCRRVIWTRAARRLAFLRFPASHLTPRPFLESGAWCSLSHSCARVRGRLRRRTHELEMTCSR